MPDAGYFIRDSGEGMLLCDKIDLMKKNIGVLAFLVLSSYAWATDPYQKNKSFNIVHYHFYLEVNDSTDVVYGEATVSVLFKKIISFFELDLANKNNLGKGMETIEVSMNGTNLHYLHRDDKLKINLSVPAKENETLVFKIKYKGEPQDGLIIGKNKYGDRGFFGDNWPDRAHQWLPVADHPSEKSPVDFTVSAPLHYSVVANGIKVEESFVNEKRKITRWQEDVPIPTKVMVVGIARFATELAGKVDHIPVESWVYPQNKTEGFYDYAVATSVLDFFHTHIGSYSYQKLANVQSKTRWGGLENANTIFYSENSITGKGRAETLIAHEVAHQWFGNSATEKDWPHIWLSEGFATYFALLYLEHVYGHDRLVSEELNQRKLVVDFYYKNAAPVVDTTVTELGKLLSINSYQKGGWVLHMLRHEVGDINFWRGVQHYYSLYKNSNALTGDFQRAMEEATGKDLSGFFMQWIYQGGHPKIGGSWHYDLNSKTLSLELIQLQSGGLKKFPLEIGIGSGPMGEVQTVFMTGKNQSFTFVLPSKPIQIVLDPNTWLLFEGGIQEK
jgi:aminopeptidase N